RESFRHLQSGRSLALWTVRAPQGSSRLRLRLVLPGRFSEEESRAMNRKIGRMVGFGADVGGTFSKIVLADAAGRVRDHAQIETACHRGPRDFVERLSNAA